MVPVLMAAGVLQYPRRKFLAALATGRAVRFFALALMGRFYGTAIIATLNRYYQPLLYTLIALAGLAGVAALLYFTVYRRRRQREERTEGKRVENFPLPFHKQKKSEKNRRSR
jgi:membrane protein DedA with SNARE-associated domain